MDIPVPWIPEGMAVPAELPEEAIVRELYEQKNQLQLEAHIAGRRKKALATAEAVRVEIRNLGAEPRR